MGSWYVYLDESGSFVSNVDEPSLIGGMIFTDDGQEETHSALLDRCLQQAAAEKGWAYPNGFHSTEQNTGANGQRFGEFARWLFDSGDGMALRRQFFARRICFPVMALWLQRSDDEEEPAAQRLLDEDTLEIRYREMMRAVLRQIILACPAGTQLYMHIPTREAHVNADRQQDFQNFGSSEVAAGVYRVNDPEVIRTMLADALLRCGREHEVTISGVAIRSINYHAYGQERTEMAGYYLADLLCDDMKKVCKGTVGGWRAVDPQMLEERYAEMFGREPMFFEYGRMSRLFDKMLDLARTDDAYGLLHGRVGLMADAQRLGGARLLRLAERMGSLTDEKVRYMEDRLFYDYYRQSEYDRVMPLYQELLRWLEAAGGGDWSAAFAVRAKLMACHLHRGEVAEAEALFRACYEMRSASVTDRMRLENQYCSSPEDQFEFAEAKRRASWLIGILERRVQNEQDDAMLLGAAYEPGEMQRTLGRCQSTLARECAFLGEPFEEAAEAFERALHSFGEDSGNCAITLTHYLHLIADVADERAFALLAQLGDAAFGAEAGSMPLKREARNLNDPAVWRTWLDKAEAFAAIDAGGVFQLAVLLKLLLRYVQYSRHAGLRTAAGTMLFTVRNRTAEGRIRKGERRHPYELIYRYMAQLAGLQKGPAYQAAVREYAAEAEAVGEAMGSTVLVLSRMGSLKIGLQTGLGEALMAQRRRALREALVGCREAWKAGEDSAVAGMIREMDAAGSDDAKIVKLLRYEYD
ncbi:MAG: hypothetical protein J6K32_11310 [Clostridia bacterium]|nr:hypothetical protein [Clostridia bacterium]